MLKKLCRSKYLIAIFILTIIVMTSGCCSFQRSAADTVCANTIIGSWELPGKDLTEPITLTVDSRGKVNGFGGVNYYNGQLRDTFANGSFQFDGAVAATMRYGRGINQERDFFQKLNQIDSWQVNADGILELRAKGKIILKFVCKKDSNSR